MWCLHVGEAGLNLEHGLDKSRGVWTPTLFLRFRPEVGLVIGFGPGLDSPNIWISKLLD